MTRCGWNLVESISLLTLAPSIGWKKRRRVHGCVIHIDIIGDKVWLQHGSTDAEIARQLVDLGIPKQDIVLGFQPPYRRKNTGFATG
ncbi:MAG: XisI protein [Candidatus Poribacteria bacterium]|nr:XisI protein [Candidatus Poribacteria bacterium]